MAGLEKYRPSEWMNRVITSEGQLSWPLLAPPWGINAGSDNFSPCSRVLRQWPFLWISLAPAQVRMHDIFLLAAVVWSALCRRWGRDLSGTYLETIGVKLILSASINERGKMTNCVVISVQNASELHKDRDFTCLLPGTRYSVCQETFLDPSRGLRVFQNNAHTCFSS